MVAFEFVTSCVNLMLATPGVAALVCNNNNNDPASGRSQPGLGARDESS
jgi:hypothetical protein